MTASVYEAEIVALSDGAKQLSKIRNYIDGCGFLLGPTVVYEDNTSGIRYACDIELARPARSLNQHLHYGRGKQQTGIIELMTTSQTSSPSRFPRPSSSMLRRV